MIERWLRFNAVGVLGAAVQLGALALLKSGLGVGTLPATALAVEAAVLHNFAWHEQWTWRTRGTPGMAARLAKFHLANGLVSVAVNVVWMHLLAQFPQVHYLAANAAAIAAASLVNFALGERLVFRR